MVRGSFHAPSFHLGSQHLHRMNRARYCKPPHRLARPSIASLGIGRNGSIIYIVVSHSKDENSSNPTGSQLAHPLREFELTELPSVQQTLLAQVDVLDRGDILRRRFADST